MSPRHGGLIALVAILALTVTTAAAVAVTTRGDARPNTIRGTSKADRLFGGPGSDRSEEHTSEHQSREYIA